jgi:hypothetical protein
LLETCAIIIGLAYNFRLNNPFSTYGEGIFLVLQNSIIISLILTYKGKNLTLALLGLINACFVYAIYNEDTISMQLLKQLQVGGIFLVIGSRVPQIYSNICEKSTGQLSFISCFLQFAGSLARVFTTYQYLFNL